MALNTNSSLSRNADPYAGITIRTAYDPLRGNYDYYYWTGDPKLAPASLRGAPPKVSGIDMNAPEASGAQAASDSMQAWITANRAAAAELNSRLQNPNQPGAAQMPATNQYARSARVNTPQNYTGPGSTIGRGPNDPVQSPFIPRPMSYSIGGWTGNTNTRPMPPSNQNMNNGVIPFHAQSQAPMGADQSWLSQQGGAFNPYRPEQINTSPGGLQEFPRGNANGSVSGGYVPYGGAGTQQPAGGGITQSQRNGGALGRPTQINTSPGGLQEFPRGNANGSVSGGYYPPPQQQPPTMPYPSYQGGGMTGGGGGFSSTGFTGIAPAGYGNSYGQMGQPQRYQFGSVNGAAFGSQPPANVMNNLFGQGSALGQMFW